MALKAPKARRQPSGQGPSGINSARTMKKSRQGTINIPLIIISGIVGIVSWVIGSILYSALIDSLHRVLLIGILFAGLTILLCGVVFIYSKASGNFEQNILTGDNNELSTFVVLMLAVIIIFLASMLFQWLYGLNIDKQILEPSSFVFIIDDSGSMATNDPSQERYRAISDALKDMPDSFDYIVYSFSDDSHIVREMAPKSDGLKEITGISSGGTSINGTLNQVLDDYEKGHWTGGASPKVILLTDGHATDIGLFTSIRGVLRRYVSDHISISTVGLGDVDTSLMTRIAKTTGGVFIDVKKASELSVAMTAAAKEYSSRDLLSARYQPSLNFLYGFLRILFLTLLGLGIGFSACVAYGLQDTVSLTLTASFISAFIGALLMELGTSLVGLSDRFMWLILWILISVVIAVKISSYVGRQQRTPRKPCMTPSSSARTVSKW